MSVQMFLFATSILLTRSAASRRVLRSLLSTITPCEYSGLKIAVLAAASDHGCLTMLKHLPAEAQVLAQGEDIDALKADNPRFTEAECLLVVSGNGGKVQGVIQAMPRLKWIHGIFAGLDHMRCPEFDNCTSERGVVVSNAKGIFSSSLAEWILGAAWYFNKDIPRLNANKEAKNYDRYTVGEMRGKTMGIIGYGDIGRAVAKLANAYGMKVVAHRRRPELSKDDTLIDEIHGNDGIRTVMQKSDFLVVAAALTEQTKGMIGRSELQAAKVGQVFMNVGRGQLIDENALIEALQKGDRIAYAALDVFATEPLPKSSPIWTLPNVRT